MQPVKSSSFWCVVHRRTWFQVAAMQLSLAVVLGLGAASACAQSKRAGAPAVSTNAETASALHPSWRVGPWIWEATTRDKQVSRLWRAFDIPSGAVVTKALLRISVDNGYRLMLDGRELGTGSDWRSTTEYDVGLLLKPGRHVLAVEAFNDNREAGMQFGLRVWFADGSNLEIPSDTSWRVAPEGERGWERRREAPAHWGRAVEVGSLLPRWNTWTTRTPTMVVRVPALTPVQEQFWQSGWFQATLAAILGVSVLVCFQLMARLAAQAKARELLQRERARIARDIHDELGARLTELALEGEVAQTELPAGSEAGAKLAGISEKARALSGAMDEVVWLVNSRRDTLRDFASHACKHARRFLEPTPIRCRLDLDADLPDVPLELPVRRNLLLAVKEALNNAAKYSGASELFLRIHRRGAAILVVVEDNGRGFDLEQADSARNGLTNMSQRMKEISGKFRIVTQIGAGCRVEFEVPLLRSSRLFAAPNVALLPKSSRPETPGQEAAAG